MPSAARQEAAGGAGCSGRTALHPGPNPFFALHPCPGQACAILIPEIDESDPAFAAIAELMKLISVRRERPVALTECDAGRDTTSRWPVGLGAAQVQWRPGDDPQPLEADFTDAVVFHGVDWGQTAMLLASQYPVEMPQNGAWGGPRRQLSAAACSRGRWRHFCCCAC